jgi:hypothetical protein
VSTSSLGEDFLEEAVHQDFVWDMSGPILNRRPFDSDSGLGFAAEFGRWLQLPRIPWRGGEGEWTALGVSADSPLLPGMDDRTAELADPLERRG